MIAANGRPRFWAFVWTLVFAFVVGLGILRITPEAVRTDLRAMLPASGEAAEDAELLSRTAESSAREVWVLLSHFRPEEAARAADAMRASLANQGFTLKDPAAGFNVPALTRALLPHRAGFLTDSDRAWLEQADDKALLHRAMQRIYRPVSTGVGSIADDPLGLFEYAVAAQEHAARFELQGKRLVAIDPVEKKRWIVMQLAASSAVSADGSEPITRALARAQAETSAAVPCTEFLTAGIPLIGEAAAARADREASRIGTVSTVGIAFLTILFFARVLPVVQALAILSATLVFAFCSVVAVFGEIHLITLVFGATLIGVCVDYIFHFLCAVSDGLSGPEAAAGLARPLTLSLTSSVAAYAVTVSYTHLTLPTKLEV